MAWKRYLNALGIRYLNARAEDVIGYLQQLVDQHERLDENVFSLAQGNFEALEFYYRLRGAAHNPTDDHLVILYLAGLQQQMLQQPQAMQEDPPANS